MLVETVFMSNHLEAKRKKTFGDLTAGQFHVKSSREKINVKKKDLTIQYKRTRDTRIICAVFTMYFFFLAVFGPHKNGPNKQYYKSGY